MRPNQHVCIVIGLYLLITAISAHANVTGTWTGVEKQSSELRIVRFKIDQAQGLDKQNGSKINNTGPASPRTALMGGIPIKGTMSRRIAPIHPGRRFALGEETIMKIDGRYFPIIGILGFRFNGAWNDGAAMIGVLDPSKMQMVAIHTGMAARNRVPFVLAFGDKLPKAVSQLLPYDLDGLQKHQEQITSTQQSNNEYIQQLQVLNLEMTTAYQSGDKQRTMALQKQIMELNQKMIQKRNQQARKQLDAIQYKGQNGSPQQQMMALQVQIRQAALAKDSDKARELQLELQKLMMSIQQQVRQPAQQTRCPDNIVAWVGKMDFFGASFKEFKGLAQLSNLFRPDVFSAHFGKPFAQMTGAEKSKIAFDLQRICIRKGSDFYTSPNATSIQSAFGDTSQFSSIDAGIGGIALERIAQWGTYTLAKSKKEWRFEEILVLEHLYAKFLNIIWPKELETALANLAEAKNTVAYDALVKRLNQWAQDMETTGIEALRNMSRIKSNAFYRILTKPFQERADLYLNKTLDKILPPYLARSPNATVAMDDLSSLTKNAQWYRAHNDIFATLSGTPIIKQYQKELGRQRNRVYKALQHNIEKEIQTLDTRSAVISFGSNFVLPLDNSYSQIWRQLERKRMDRLTQVEWETHVARVGEGPFDPHHPGAVYLNALYRNDHDILKQEDAVFAAPFRDFTKPLTQSGIFQLVSLFPGGNISPGQLQQRFEAELGNLSMSDILAGFFIVSYKHFYPNCMGNAVTMKRTVVWDKVIRDVLNDDPWDGPETQTYYYTIKAEHADVFQRVGVGKSPEEMEFISGLFGSFFPSNLRQSQAGLTTVLRGLRKAMKEMPCNDPGMKQLEKNLMRRSME